MKRFINIISLVLIAIVPPLHAQHDLKSYQDGIASCESKMKKLKESLKGNSFVRVGPSCLEGYLLPELEMEDMTNYIWNRDKLKGKQNVINLWFTTCNPCIMEMPYLNQIKNEFNTDKVNFIAIARDETEVVEEFLENNIFDFNIISNGARLIDSTFHNLWGYPLTIITDENLVIVKAISGTHSRETLRQSIIPILSK